MSDCPKFHRCNAPVCPLGPDAASRRYLDGEPVCLYLLEYAKPGSEARLQAAMAAEHYDSLSKVYAMAVNSYGGLRRRLSRASKTGSRLNIQIQGGGND
ncbi:hypothetical protein [Thiohalophilus sp.]|uniref:hypothetical protein n=1 Tax=Thiohalophilus sp. TaxID=3028392 RepID=UPI002ACDEEED|nr:hypothetical protein [Thiohalophilus sp.]MDZ7662520.1 hypothetical protein [Thiohalophilus sp.]